MPDCAFLAECSVPVSGPLQRVTTLSDRELIAQIRRPRSLSGAAGADLALGVRLG
ncbi:hypothetical protein J2W21_003710 [Sinomonas atrocyanea]|nr:hypothetical protein [Sinomonas atrocyanea]